MSSNVDSAPVTVTFREDDRNDAHVRVSVFIGRNEGARGHAGQLVMRTDEWDEARPWLETFGEWRHVLECSENGWHVEHAPQCRPSLRDCKVFAAVREIDVGGRGDIADDLTDWGLGRWFVWLNDRGVLMTETIT